MKASQCEQCIPWLPAYMPKVVAGVIGLVVATICLILYFVREKQRHKNFYGKEDKLSFREEDDPRKNLEMDVAAFGGCPDELVATMAGDSQTPERGVKVMVLKKVRVPNKTPCMPMHKQITPQQNRPEFPYQLFLQVLSDKMGRGQELLDVIKKYPVPVGSRTKVANAIVESVYDILEKMTRKHFVVFGMMDKGRSVVCGQEHMAENVEEMSLQIRLQLVKPFSLNISAYQVEVSTAAPAPAAQVAAPAAVLEVKEPPQGKMTEREGHSKIATDVTPMVTPMLPSTRKSERPPMLLAETPVSGHKPHASKSRMSSSALLNAIRNMSKDRKEVDSHALLVPPPSSPGKEGEPMILPRARESKASSGRPGIHIKLPPQPKSKKEASKPRASKVSPQLQQRQSEGVEKPGSKNLILPHHDSSHGTDKKLSDTHRSSEHLRTPFKDKQERHESKVQKSKPSSREKLKNERSKVRESPIPKERGKSKQSGVLVNGLPAEVIHDKVRSRNSGRVPDAKQKEKSPPPVKITL